MRSLIRRLFLAAWVLTAAPCDLSVRIEQVPQ